MKMYTSISEIGEGAGIKADCEKLIEPLIGADDFKSLMREIISVGPRIIKDKTRDVFDHQYYLFAIEDGCDIENYISIMREVLSRNGLTRLSSESKSTFVRVPPQKEKEKLYQDAVANISSLMSKGSNLVCLDITEWLSELQNPDFKRILIFLESNYDRCTLVFRIPYLDKEIVDRIYATLSDVLTVRKVLFPPLSIDRLIEYAKAGLSKYDFEAEDEVWELFRARIIQEKNEGKFYEKMTVDKLVRELVYKKQCADAAVGECGYSIRLEDVKGFADETYAHPETASEMMESLTGLDGIKEQILEITRTIAYMKNDKTLESPCIHMRFVGNPGTGKTTVARIVGKLLKEKGVLSKGDFFEVTGRNLCGTYVGQTAPLTERICRDAYGSVLFIDEAYTLYGKDTGETDYGKEALVTLMGEMENHRNDFVVIMAGYGDEMDALMDANPGLLSRMPFYLEFPNYSREELTSIFMNMIPEGISCGEGFTDSVRRFFDGIGGDMLCSKEFSNARLVRNLFEMTLSKAITRQENSGGELSLTPLDFELACESKSIAQLMNVNTRTRLGF